MITKVTFDRVEKLPFYLYPLHKQPEASVDVIGKYYDDQLLNIRNISSQLEDDQYLLVKEHSNAIGDRGYKFYKQLNRYPRVLLVDEKVNTKALMELSLGVFTVSGTAALEASLKGISSYCFSAVYFRHLKSCNVVTLNDFNEQVNSQTDETSHLSNEEFVNTMLKSACDGIISNPRSDSRCVSAENIVSVASEFYDLIKK
jgi:capsule polysaccharide modification protein KpsS